MSEGEEKKRSWLGYVIVVAIEIGITAMILSTNHILSVGGKREVYRILSDAFGIPGIIMILIGVLTVISDSGEFYGIGYSFRYLGDRLMPGRSSKKPLKYADYVDNKRSKPHASLRTYFLLPGAGFAIVGLVFLILFNV